MGSTRARGRSWTVWTIVILLLLSLLGGGAWLRRDQIRTSLSDLRTSSSAAAIQIQTVTISRPPEPAPVLTATGRIVSDHRVQVATKVSGQVVAILFEQGDSVEKAQLLARIEDVNYRARRNEASARLERSQAVLEFQKVNFQRVASLIEGESAPPIEFADALRWLRESEARVAEDQAALEFWQKALDDTQVTAPIAGVVLSRNVEVGDFVSAEGGRGANANAQFAVIADMTKLRVEVDISEMDIVRIRKDMPCIVTPDAYKDRKYEGYVLWVDPGANYSKATVQAKVRIREPDGFLRVEGSAQVSFLQEQRAEAANGASAIWIPVGAYLSSPGENAGKVFTAVEGRLRERSIIIGRRSGNQVEVIQGLAAGDRVAVDGVAKLRDGQVLPN